MNGFMNVRRCGSGFKYVRNRSIVRMKAFLLVASSCSGGYSIVKPPWPMLPWTCVIEWHDVQANPACASGVSICSLIGRSNRPLKNTAWS
jgi:hypothetical protein